MADLQKFSKGRQIVGRWCGCLDVVKLTERPVYSAAKIVPEKSGYVLPLQKRKWPVVADRPFNV
jgi:hypothetical protein